MILNSCTFQVNFDITCLDWEIALRFYDKFKGRGCECGSQGASATNLLLSRVPRRPRRSSSVADLEELFDVFVPGISGHQVNTHLDTLKLFPASASEAECFIKELCRMLKLNTTLKHVEVVPVGWIKSWTIGEDYRYWKGPLDVELDLRRILELIMRYELRLNTSLQSLVLGYWNVLRVGGRWQKSYQHGGPCLKVQSTGESKMLSTQDIYRASSEYCKQ